MTKQWVRDYTRKDVETIYGVPFAAYDGDYTQCQLCGEVVDLGGELRQHANDHKFGGFEND